MSNKYPRTFHLPWSEGATQDDKISHNISLLINSPIVITEKLDGSNTCLEKDNCFARTHSGPPTHPSFALFKALHATVKNKIPENLQLFGEFCFARHSIEYSELPGYFLMFGIRELSTKLSLDNKWLAWEEVEMWASEIDVPAVPVLFRGQVSSKEELEDLTKSFMNQPSVCGGLREGIVVRVADLFLDENFPSCLQKMVRPNHVQTSEHWKNQEIVRNKLK